MRRLVPVALAACLVAFGVQLAAQNAAVPQDLKPLLASLHDAKNLLHECVDRLHVFVGRARMNVRAIAE